MISIWFSYVFLRSSLGSPQKSPYGVPVRPSWCGGSGGRGAGGRGGAGIHRAQSTCSRVDLTARRRSMAALGRPSMSPSMNPSMNPLEILLELLQLL